MHQSPESSSSNHYGVITELSQINTHSVPAMDIENAVKDTQPLSDASDPFVLSTTLNLSNTIPQQDLVRDVSAFDADNGHYWSTRFTMLAIQFPTTKERNYWAIFLLSYGVSVAAATFYSLTQSISLATELTLAPQGLSRGALSIIEWLAKGAAMSLIILYADLAKELLSNSISGLSSLYAAEKNFTVVLKHLPAIFLKAIPTMAVAGMAASASANATYKNLTASGQLAPSAIQYYCAMAMLGCSISYFTLLDAFIIKPFVKQWRNFESSKPATDRQALRTLQGFYITKLATFINTVNQPFDNALSNPQQSPQQVLWRHFCASRDAKTLPELFANAIDFSYDPTLLNQLAPKKRHQDLKNTIQAAMCLIFALIYCLPNLAQGLQANAFVKDSLSLTILSPLIGAAFYSVMTTIYFLSAKTLWDTLATPFKYPSTYNEATIFMAKSVLIVLNLAAQLLLTIAFPFTFTSQSNLAIANLQLVMTALITPGSVLFAVDWAFDKLRHYHNAWASRERLQATEIIRLTHEDIHTIHHYLNANAFALISELDRAPSLAIEALYNDIHALLIRRDVQHESLTDPDSERTLPAASLLTEYQPPGEVIDTPLLAVSQSLKQLAAAQTHLSTTYRWHSVERTLV